MTLDPLALSNQSTLHECLSTANAELQRRRWLHNPALFIEERLGESLRPWQQESMESVRDNILTVASSEHHNTGRTWLASRVVLWWIESHLPGTAIAITTAPTWRQVEALWMEIRRGHAQGKLAGRTNRTEWLLPVCGREEHVALGCRPSDDDATSMQGVFSEHALVVFDEADAVPAPMWDVAESITSNVGSRWLAVGQSHPSPFDRACKPGSGWNVVISGE